MGGAIGIADAGITGNFDHLATLLVDAVFLDEWVTPMMTPGLAERMPAPADLAQAQLLHQDDIRFLDPPCDWPAWFNAAGLPPRDWTGQRFSQADHALDAALSGAGVILGRISLAARLLSEGRLVAPYLLGLRTEAHYRILCVKGSETRPHIAAFRSWLRDQTAVVSEHDRHFELIKAGNVPRSAG
ncbi:LysR substrate-binding domain-containing protein [Roseovarius sp. MMSF_3281]|uniref:LysR substrate-binding domain-containing protein n=1 Tax=Roseovarius sp. MMSF_3281 TaxID=3046694 RepID=UPI00273D2556|nr:LysR substrate-binding domain-containing protein [Roseovarius sp. MMSF_3281]